MAPLRSVRPCGRKSFAQGGAVTKDFKDAPDWIKRRIESTVPNGADVQTFRIYNRVNTHTKGARPREMLCLTYRYEGKMFKADISSQRPRGEK